MRFPALVSVCCMALGGCTAVVSQSSFFPASASAPQSTLAAPAGYRLEDRLIDLPSLGRVHAVRLDNPNSDAVVVYSGGNMSFVAGQTHTAAALAAATGADIIFYDYPGRGGTDFPATVDNLIAFGPAFVADLRAHDWIGTGPLFFYGLSFGGGQAAGMARGAGADGLIIEGSAADIAAIGANAVPAMMKPFVHIRLDDALQSFDYAGYALQAEAPVLLLSSQDDAAVAPRIMTAFADQLRAGGAQVALVSVPGPHGGALRTPAGTDALRRFTHLQ